MRELLRVSTVAATLILLLGWAGSVQGQDFSAEEVKLIKQTPFTTLDGKQVTTSDLEGKMVLLDFWETWCSPCLESFPGMQKALSEYPEHFAVLAVNSNFADTKEDVRKFIQKNDYGFLYAMDSNQLLAEKLGIRSIPFKIFIGPDGKLIESNLGKLPDEYQHIKDLLSRHTDAEIES